SPPALPKANRGATKPLSMPSEIAPDNSVPESSTELSLPQLVKDVAERNPSLEAMYSAWKAAAERYPQVISLDDPMFMAMAAPASFWSHDVESAYAFQLNQKFPWYGKRAARGRQARAESGAAFHDLQDSRVRLAE